MPVTDHPTIRDRYASLAAFKAANRANGFHFFDADSMRFFGSRVESELIHGRFFITSERMPESEMARGYTVRVALPNGGTGDVGGFRAHATLEAARAAVPAHDWRPPLLSLFRRPDERSYVDSDIAAAFEHFRTDTGDTPQHASTIEPDSNIYAGYAARAIRLP